MNAKQQTVIICSLVVARLVLGCSLFTVPAAPTATNMPPTETPLPAAPAAPTALPTIVPTDTATLVPALTEWNGIPSSFSLKHDK
jgi:hypothetical protein